MQKNTVTKSFEQIQTTLLPKEVLKIVIGLSREIRRSARKGSLQPKQLEVAYATLHMRIYQRFGHVSNELMNQTYAELERLLSDNHTPSVIGGFRKAITGRFF